MARVLVLSIGTAYRGVSITCSIAVPARADRRQPEVFSRRPRLQDVEGPSRGSPIAKAPCLHDHPAPGVDLDGQDGSHAHVAATPNRPDSRTALPAGMAVTRHTMLQRGTFGPQLRTVGELRQLPERWRPGLILVRYFEHNRTQARPLPGEPTDAERSQFEKVPPGMTCVARTAHRILRWLPQG